MKKITIYTLILAVIALFGVSAYKEATKTGAKSKRLACHEKVTVFEKLHHPEALKGFKKEGARISASVEIVPSVYRTSTLFAIVPQAEIEAMVEKHLRAKLGEQNLLHVAVTAVENDKGDPGKKNAEAKAFLGYVKASYYENATLVYQIQVDFLEPSGIAGALLCIDASVTSLP